MSTFYDEFVSIFGEYSPIITENTDGTLITDINWAYILGVGCFLIFMYCCLRVLGSVICKDR